MHLTFAPPLRYRGGAWDNAKKYIGAGHLDELIAQLEPECAKDGEVRARRRHEATHTVT